MRGEVGKETPKKEMDFYDVTRDILGFLQLYTSYQDLLTRERCL